MERTPGKGSHDSPNSFEQSASDFLAGECSCISILKTHALSNDTICLSHGAERACYGLLLTCRTRKLSFEEGFQEFPEKGIIHPTCL